MLFGDFTNEGSYVEAKSVRAVDEALNAALENYNAMFPSAPMALVLFEQALRHVARIARVIRLPRGHCLLVGVGGSGRQSLTRLAAAITDYELRTITVTKGYGVADWREDLQRLFRRAGCDNRPVVFLFSDALLGGPNELTFLEDINNILNSGVVPNVFPPDKYEEVLTAVTPDAIAAGQAASPAAVYGFFTARCQANVHVVLCLSPIGDGFRNRLRQFPSLINCCTVDVFEEWSRDALIAVGRRLLADVCATTGLAHTHTHLTCALLPACIWCLAYNALCSVLTTPRFPLPSLPTPRAPQTEIDEALRPRVEELLVDVHLGAADLARRFKEEQRRVVHVTPTSFLIFVNTFARLLREKRAQVRATLQRYQNGLAVLDKADKEVTLMKSELDKMTPISRQLHQETVELMKSIEADQKRAAESKAVRSCARMHVLLPDKTRSNVLVGCGCCCCSWC